MMNRRAFLQRVSAGVVSAFVVAKVPTGWIPEPVRTYAACEFLRREYNSFVAALRARGVPMRDAFPDRMTAGRELYDAYASEITANMRYTATDDVMWGVESLMFKGARLRPVGHGWRVECQITERAA